VRIVRDLFGEGVRFYSRFKQDGCIRTSRSKWSDSHIDIRIIGPRGGEYREVSLNLSEARTFASELICLANDLYEKSSAGQAEARQKKREAEIRELEEKFKDCMPGDIPPGLVLILDEVNVLGGSGRGLVKDEIAGSSPVTAALRCLAQSV
jgi:hypothetical protein